MMRKLIVVFVFMVATMCAMIGVKRYRRIVSEYRDTSDILVVCASNHLNDAIEFVKQIDGKDFSSEITK